MPALVIDLIIVGAILFGVQFVLSMLAHVVPGLHGPVVQIIAYLSAAVVFIFVKYRRTRGMYINPHKAEVDALSKAGRPKPAVWTMPDDRHDTDSSDTHPKPNG